MSTSTILFLYNVSLLTRESNREPHEERIKQSGYTDVELIGSTNSLPPIKVYAAQLLATNRPKVFYIECYVDSQQRCQGDKDSQGDFREMADKQSIKNVCYILPH